MCLLLDEQLRKRKTISIGRMIVFLDPRIILLFLSSFERILWG